ncbi:hypothetical protein M5689_015863 [Euphorbia peplus]|nr:hypothetical protein M5689_015863 [Euphorbia peplus]
MEFKSTIISSFLLFLLVLPHTSRGRYESERDSEIYEIDYRGPETHSSALPPPGRGRSHGRPSINTLNVMSSSPKSKLDQQNAKKIHG